LKVFRGGQERTLTVEIGLLDEQVAVRTPSSGEFASPEEASSVGMSVAELTPEIARSLGYGPEARGVVVTDVDANGIAARAGISPRDVIVRVGETRVNSVSEFRSVINDANLEEGVVLYVRSGGAQRIVFLRNAR
jgi:serine protease Do